MESAIRRLATTEREALVEFAREVRSRFGIRVSRLVLFGSRARGEGDEDSDLDVLVLVHDLTAPEAREIAHMAGDVLTRHDVLVSPLTLSTARFEDLVDRERQIVREIDRDGIPV